MKTEITHKELMSVWAPIWDAIQRVKNLGYEYLTTKLKSAEAPLAKLIDKIEKENPEQFGPTG